MIECTIPALLAAIEFLIQINSPSLVLTNPAVLTVCDWNHTSSACFEQMAAQARVKEEAYREAVFDVVSACERKTTKHNHDPSNPLQLMDCHSYLPGCGGYGWDD